MGFFSHPFKSLEHLLVPLTSKIGQKLATPIADIALAATGNPEFIPLANAGITTASDLINGQSIGKSLGQGAISGGEALAGQEALGALGIGSGNSFFNSTLGITGDNPAGTGLPDLGSDFSGILNSLGISGGGAGDATSSVNFPSSSTGFDFSAPDASQLANVGSSAGEAGGFQYDINGNPIGANNALSGAIGISTAATPTTPAGATSTLGKIGEYVGNHPSLALGGAGLALDALKSNKPTGAEKNQEAIAGQEANLGNQQIALGTSGQLAPGQQAALQQQLNASIAGIRSQFANMGMSGSTSEAQAIAQARATYAANVQAAAQNEINAGLSALGQGSASNQAIVNSQLQSSPDLAKAIISLAGATGGSTQKAAA